MRVFTVALFAAVLVDANILFPLIRCLRSDVIF